MSTIELIHGDCLEKLKDLPDNSVDSIVTDPPYGLSFMGKKWDYDVPSEEVWRECLRVLKPGGHLLAFAGTRTQHRMAVRIEDAGFEIRDMIAWVYGSGFPKSLNIGKAVDKIEGNERESVPDPEAARRNKATSKFSGLYGEIQDKTDFVTKGTSPHEGWGTALKPALEPITVARKPLIGTVAENVLTHGTGGINIDQCRVESTEFSKDTGTKRPQSDEYVFKSFDEATRPSGSGASSPLGRFPANLIHDGSEEVLRLFPGEDDKSAARFFYAPKASKKDRDEGLEGFEVKHTAAMAGNMVDGQRLAGNGTPIATPVRANHHPTVKPTDLMRYLCRLVTPPNGTVLDPFMGSGSTGKAAKLEGFGFIGIEREAEYVEIAKARINGTVTPLFT